MNANELGKYPDPLGSMSSFSPPPAQPRSIPVVSVVVETRPEMMDRIRRITEWHRRWFRFHREIVISVSDPHIPGTAFVACGVPPHDTFATWYSDMCVRWMHKLCDSGHMLFWQWNGFIVNPQYWNDEFLQWDYVGAPLVSDQWKGAARWLQQARGWVNPLDLYMVALVGNGRFSLRSRRFLSSCASFGVPLGLTTAGHDDLYLCVERRRELENMGLRFCPVGLASRFSKEESDGRTMASCFGFHGSKSLAEAKVMLESRCVPKGAT